MSPEELYGTPTLQRRVMATIYPSRVSPQHIVITSYDGRDKIAEVSIDSRRAYQLAEQLLSLARWIDR